MWTLRIILIAFILMPFAGKAQFVYAKPFHSFIKKVRISDSLVITAGSPATGKVLTSDENGFASWQMPLTGAIVSTLVNASYAIQADDSHIYVNAPGASSGINITFPPAASNAGRIIWIYKLEVNGQSFSIGGTTVTQSVFVCVCDGSNWNTKILL